MRDAPYETYEVDGVKVEIRSDDDPPNPRRDYDPMGHMICFHRRYDLGDKHTMTPEELAELVKRDDVIWLPLYLYDHSGITMYTSGDTTYHQHAAWDTSTVGAIYMTMDEAREVWGDLKTDNAGLRESALKCLRACVEEYDQYLTGDVWGYVVAPDEEDESCWGFFGLEHCKEEATAVAKGVAEDRLNQRQERVKTYIRNRVPLDKRLAVA